jgi:hypothetical protein
LNEKGILTVAGTSPNAVVELRGFLIRWNL